MPMKLQDIAASVKNCSTFDFAELTGRRSWICAIGFRTHSRIRDREECVIERNFPKNSVKIAVTV